MIDRDDAPREPLFLRRHTHEQYTELARELRDLETLGEVDRPQARRVFDELRPRLVQIPRGRRFVDVIEQRLATDEPLELLRTYERLHDDLTEMGIPAKLVPLLQVGGIAMVAGGIAVCVSALRGATDAETSPYGALLVAGAGVFLLLDRLRTTRLRVAAALLPVVLGAIVVAVFFT